MDSRNNTSRNDKQQELVKRLEEIRRQRNTIQTAESQRDDTQNEKRNQNRQEPTPQRTTRSRQAKQTTTQNRNAQRMQSTRQSTEQESNLSNDLKREVDEYYNDDPIKLGKNQDEIRNDDLTLKNKKTTRDYSETLINQLSNSENLTQAIILNEILSKPIALRYKNR